MSASYAYKMAVVEWIDAWLSDTLQADQGCIRYTAGWLVHNNSKIVRIALTVDGRGPGDVMNIPRSLVRRVKIVGEDLLQAETPEDEIEPPEADVLAAKNGY